MRRAEESTAYLLRGGLTGVAALGTALAVAVAAVLCLALVGVPLLAGTMRGVRSLAAGERRRLLGITVPHGHPSLPVRRSRSSSRWSGTRRPVEQTLTALREVVRSIYPPILADRGLAEAVRTLTAESPARVRTSIGALVRPPAAVESGRCWPSWPRGTPTARSRPACTSPNAPSTSTSATSSSSTG